MNTTLELSIDRSVVRRDGDSKDCRSVIESIDKHLEALAEEKTVIEDTWKELSQFLLVNAVYPLNDDIASYFQLFIQEEHMKQQNGARNDNLIKRLERMKTNYEDDITNFRRELSSEKNSCSTTKIVSAEEVFPMVGTLYHLPINGNTIRAFVDTLKQNESRTIRRREKVIDLTGKTARSSVMRTLTNSESENF